mgnify:CR=1 FL=1
MRGRRPSKKSKFYLPPRHYAYAVSFALMRDEWAAEVNSLRNHAKAIRYDKPKIQANGDYNATEAAAIEAMELTKKIELIDAVIREVSEGLDNYIKLAVCNGFTFTQLTTGKYRMPLNQNKFGEIKHRFYYTLFSRI